MIKVHYLCNYYPQKAHTNERARIQPQWDAFKYCKAVKTRTINGHCTVPTKPNGTRIDSNSIANARVLFGHYIKLALKARFDECWLVPVPSKDSFETCDFRSLIMLREALPQNHDRIVPCLRFTASLPKASEGGPRGLHELLPHLGASNVPLDRPIVLVDDILTTGGTMLACKTVLNAHNANVSEAVVCGRTSSDPDAPAFANASHDLMETIDYFSDLTDF